jgi:hypothetical protein
MQFWAFFNTFWLFLTLLLTDIVIQVGIKFEFFDRFLIENTLVKKTVLKWIKGALPTSVASSVNPTWTGVFWGQSWTGGG